jgi:hypothetical protein
MRALYMESAMPIYTPYWKTTNFAWKELAFKEPWALSLVQNT